MGLKLDWEIEAEQAQVRNVGEDVESIRQRRRARIRVLLVILFVLLLFAAGALAIVLRLRYVESLIEDNLRNTVEAEVAALRIGDRSAYLGIQRSATEDWLHAQERNFDAYQSLKTLQNTQLTGHIHNVTIDGNRARVVVEEIIDGVPYARVWFYWNYEDGWRHVPPDTTFWGEVRSLSGTGLTIRYRALDEPLAAAMLPKVEAWLEDGCEILGCATLPSLTFEIVPTDVSEPLWSPANPWSMQIPSPSIDRVRLDQPFSPSLQVPVANLLASRLVDQAVDNRQLDPYSDAAYLRRAAGDWLAGRFTEAQEQSVLVDSLAQIYGLDSVRRLLHLLQPESDIQVLTEVTGMPSLDQTGLRWDDFLEWRLNLESELILNRDEANFLRLYDTGDETARTLAYNRFAQGVAPGPNEVVAVTAGTDAAGTPLLHVRVQTSNEISLSESEVVFRLVEGSWKRLN
ncbi:MAG: hypothetical protein DIU68_002365 [Chloroflexota bacterium]|nr:MAG: hypothetical protein DIU68_10005 [Chloroflexota bacterium]